MENKDKYSVGDYIRVNTNKFNVGRGELKVKEGSIIQVLDVCESDDYGVWIDPVSCTVYELNDWVKIYPDDFSLVEDFLKSEEHVAVAEGSKEAVNEALRISALTKQVSGNHYKGLKIQPAEYIHANNIGFLEGNAIKYVSRYKLKNGKADLEKAIHCIELLIELEYGR